MLVLAAAASFTLSRTNGVFDFGYGISTATLILLTLIWLPNMVRAFLLSGGTLKAASYELNFVGLLAELRSTPTSDDPEQGLVDLGNRYAILREELPPGDQRTVRLEAVVAKGRSLASSIDAATIDRRLSSFAKGSDSDRVMALALLQGRPMTYAGVYTILNDAIVNPRTNFEQYHGLLAAYRQLPYMQDADRDKLRNIIARALVEFEPGGDRAGLAQRILHGGELTHSNQDQPQR